MEPKAICFFDLDGTLLDEHSKVRSETAAAIEQLKEKNILPVIATGRALSETRHILAKSGIDSIVALNGQHIQIKGKTVYEKEIPLPVIEDFLTFNRQLDHSACFFNASSMWTLKHTQILKKVYKHLNVALPPASPASHREKKVLMMVLVSDEPAKDQLYKQAFQELDFYRNQPETVDVVLKGTNKGTGIRRFMKLFGNEMLPSYGFGDGANDVSLMQATTYGIAMGNAVPETKAAADYITGKNTDGGLIQAFHHLGLL